MASLLLGPEERKALADFLQHREPPPGFEPLTLECIRRAELATITFEELATFCDFYGASEVLDSIRWPLLYHERQGKVSVEEEMQRR